MPILGAVLAVALPGEMPTVAQIAGAALVLSGIAIVERKPQRSYFPAVEPSSQGPSQRNGRQRRRCARARHASIVTLPSTTSTG
jgi:hypothetical protein